MTGPMEEKLQEQDNQSMERLMSVSFGNRDSTEQTSSLVQCGHTNMATVDTHKHGHTQTWPLTSTHTHTHTHALTHTRTKSLSVGSISRRSAECCLSADCWLLVSAANRFLPTAVKYAFKMSLSPRRATLATNQYTLVVQLTLA